MGRRISLCAVLATGHHRNSPTPAGGPTGVGVSLVIDVFSLGPIPTRVARDIGRGRPQKSRGPRRATSPSYDDDGDIWMLRLFWTSWVNAIEHRKYQRIHIWIGPTIPVSHVTVPASGTISSWVATAGYSALEPR